MGGFKKTGSIFKIASAKTVDLEQWSDFKKQATSSSVEEITKKQTIDKESDLEVVASIDPEKFIYIHTTIMAGVKTGSNGYWITPETEKFINDNGDSWTCDDLLKDYPSFRTATTFVEHVQDLEKAKGKCIDAIARQMPDTVLIDVLFSVARKHADLVDNIKNGIINAVSMGCSTEKTICSICGHESNDPANYCTHIRNMKGQLVKCEDGKVRKAAEICKGNTFFDVSLVANPAFIGAIFRKILSSEQVNTQLISNLLNRKIESNYKNGDTLLKAASKKEGNIEIVFTKEGNVNIVEGEKELKLSNKIPQDELVAIKNIFKNKNMATKFLGTIVDTLFSKNSEGHPINNPSSEKDFTVTYNDHTPIPFNDRHNTLDDFEEQNPEHEEKTIVLVIPQMKPVASKDDVEKTSRLKNFECYNCGHKDELWNVKSASIDSGFDKVIACPKCNFITENVEIKRDNKAEVKETYKITSIDKLQLNDLGYTASDVENFDEKEIQTILANDITKANFEKDAGILHNITRALNTEDEYGKLEEAVGELSKGQSVIAQKDIPVDDDEGTLHFDEYGASVITKDEKLTYLGSVENGEYDMFRTEMGEEFFMPTAMKKQVFKGTKKEAFFNTNDAILDGFTYQDLIDTIVSNEKVRDEKAVKKVFRELMQAQTHDANATLRKEMKNILKEIEKETSGY